MAEVTLQLWTIDKVGNVRCNICGQAFSLKGFRIHFGMKHMRKI